MTKTTGVWLLTAFSLILLGLILFGGVMTMLKWDFLKLSTSVYETNRYELQENCKNITIVTDTAHIVFVPSENSKGTVACYETTNKKHSVTATEGNLVIEVNDTRKWYELIGLNFRTPKITVSLPAGEYGTLSIRSSTGDIEIPKDFMFESIDISESTGYVQTRASASDYVKIKTSTGDIQAENISAASLALSVSTGKVTVSNVTCTGDVSVNVSTGKTVMTDVVCQNMDSNGSTGKISLQNVAASGTLSIKRSTGDVHFDGCDAAEIYVTTDTGSVTGTLLSEKVFIAASDTGRIDVPKTVTGGRCEITTDTGDIRLSVK